MSDHDGKCNKRLADQHYQEGLSLLGTMVKDGFYGMIQERENTVDKLDVALHSAMAVSLGAPTTINGTSYDVIPSRTRTSSPSSLTVQ